tara:strand:- start:109 stop:711 length:603 start_codon:yes stop_codon:yes gene_type:complete
MKKETSDKKEKNQAIWEEFVSKNSIKKSYSTDRSINSNDLENGKSSTVEELVSRSNSDKNTVTAARKSYIRKSIISLIGPKIDLEIEKNKLRRIKNGKITIEGTLDLHGFSLKEAENMLRRFVGDSLRLKKRFLLIITGKGSNSKPNIHGKMLTIKSEIKNWLSDNFYDDKVQYISKALDRHGGEGAYYLFLKKSKNIFS